MYVKNFYTEETLRTKNICIAVLSWSLLIIGFSPAFSLGPSIPSARAETCVPSNCYSQLYQMCIGAQAYQSLWIYQNIGPSGHDWAVSVQFGLNGGDNNQYAVTVAKLEDSNGFVSFYKSTGLYWVYPPVAPRAGTLTLNTAGTVSLLIEIYNYDGASQCYNIYTTTAYS